MYTGPRRGSKSLVMEQEKKVKKTTVFAVVEIGSTHQTCQAVTAIMATFLSSLSVVVVVFDNICWQELVFLESILMTAKNEVFFTHTTLVP
jgi:hypothetical protein